MKKEMFGNVVRNLSQMIRDGECIAISYRKGKWVNPGIINKARLLQGNMDKVFQHEIYHIIGMGKLTATQSSKFIKLVKQLGVYRAVVKTVATCSHDDIDMPKTSMRSIGINQYNSILTETKLSTIITD